MSRFVNKSLTLTMKKAEDTFRDVSPERINGVLRRMSMDTKNKTGHHGRCSTNQGGRSGDRDRGSSELPSRSSLQSLIAASWVMLE